MQQLKVIDSVEESSCCVRGAVPGGENGLLLVVRKSKKA